MIAANTNALHQTTGLPGVHSLKTWPEYFAEVIAGRKTFEVRKDDRPYAVGDRLVLREYRQSPIGYYTGREAHRVVTYIMRGGEFCKEGYVTMGLRRLNELETAQHWAAPDTVSAISTILENRCGQMRNAIGRIRDRMDWSFKVGARDRTFELIVDADPTWEGAVPVRGRYGFVSEGIFRTGSTAEPYVRVAFRTHFDFV